MVRFLVAACLLVMGRAIFGDFLRWDDAQHLQLNRALVNGDVFYFWRNIYYGLYAPVIYTVWTLLYQLSQNPTVFHAFNLILHAANATLVYYLLRLIYPRAAFPGALLFALHPLQVEPVAWISGGRDLLATSGGLAAAYLLANRRPALASILFALGLLCKPTLFVLPMALGAFDAVSGQKLFGRCTLAGWFVIALLVVAFTYGVQSDPRAGPGLPAHALGFYVTKLFAPWNLSFSYGHDLANGFLLALLLCLAVLWNRLATAGFLFALIMLLPVLGFIPFAGQVQSLVFDRYAYLAMLGPALMFGLVCARWPAIYTLLVPLAILSFWRVGDWRSDRTLNTRALEVDPSNYYALNNLALDEIDAEQLLTAESLLRRARQYRPQMALATANLAHVYWMRKDLGSILSEIEPLTKDPLFLSFNAPEIESLALIHRMTARALSATLDYAGARSAYQRAAAYRPDDQILSEEIRVFEAGLPPVSN